MNYVNAKDVKILVWWKRRRPFSFWQIVFTSTKKYISRENRNLLLDIFSFYQRYHVINVDYELQDALRASTLKSIDAKTRERICARSFFSLKTTTKDMVDDYSIIRSTGLNYVHRMGIVLCNVLSHRRKFEISGTSTVDQFYSSVRSRWRFVNPEKYLIHYFQSSMPQG